jgi:hypothetical protein
VAERLMNRIGSYASLLLLLGPPGCGGQSKNPFHDPPSTGGSGGDGGSGGKAGNGATSGAGGGGFGAVANASGAGGNGGAGGKGGAAGKAGNGATSGDGGTNGAGTSGNPNGGAGTAGADTAGAGGATPVGPLSGGWGMFWFEDPVGVSILQQGETLTGTGCCAGLPGAPAQIACCGALEGTSKDGRASFGFPTQDTTFVYSTDVYVSDDYQRMGGTFSVDGEGSRAVAWVRIEPPKTTLGSPPLALREVLLERAGEFELMLSSAFVGRFEPLTPLTLQVSAMGFIVGEFGPFYWGDMTWYESSQALAMGPVPATDPKFASTLELRFNGNTLEAVVATYPDEPPYNFVVTGTSR